MSGKGELPMKQIQWVYTNQREQWVPGRKFHRSEQGEANLAIVDEPHPEWMGFGGCFNELGWQALQALDSDARQELLRDLFEPGYGCQFNFCRVPVGASDYASSWYSLNETEGDLGMEHFSIERDRQSLIPYIQSAQNLCPSLRLFASPWSPPTWMKYPRAYNFGTLIWERPVLAAYALYLLKFVQSYAALGIPIQQLHVQNEPVSDQKFPSCIWTGAQLRDFIRDYLGPLFEKHRVTTEIWLGTINGPEVDERYLRTTYNDYANLVLSDPHARKYIGGVGYQWRGKYAVQRTRQGWPEIPVIQTENECGDGNNSWEYAAYVFDLFYHYLTNDVIAYVYWNMVLETGGESTWGWQQNSLVSVDPKTGRITRNPEYYIMKHFSKFIHPGDHRLGLVKPWSANAVAFRSAAGRTVVIRNPFGDQALLCLAIDDAVYNFELQPHSVNSILIAD